MQATIHHQSLEISQLSISLLGVDTLVTRLLVPARGAWNLKNGFTHTQEIFVEVM